MRDGNYEESFRIKVLAGQSPVAVGDYSFEGAAPVVNSAPIAAASGNVANWLEDTFISGVLPTGSDPDGDGFSYALVGTPAGVTLNPNGNYSFTPAPNVNGNFSFQYKLIDTHGAESAPQTFTISVTPVNDAPTAGLSGNTASGNEDTVVSGMLPAGSDPDGDLLTYALVGTPSNVSLDSAGHFSYTPPANANGDFSFQYKLVDTLGLESAPQTFTVAVTPVNDAPVASELGNRVTGIEGSVINGVVPAGTDIDSSHLTYSLASNLSNLVFHADGTFSFTPAGSGDYSFQYQVVDDGGAQSAAHAFTISVAQAAGLTLNGTGGGDTLFGGNGNDIIDGRQGGDKMYGYGGNDTYYVDSSKDQIFEAVGGGRDSVVTSASFTIGKGVEIEFVQATGTSAVSLKGNDCANTLVGNAASNTLTGNGGDDILDGGLGKDTLTGGTGKDQFVFSTALGANNIDAIKDFKVVDDTIVLDRSVFAALSEGALHQSDFVRGTQAVHAFDHIIYDSTGGRLLYDVDGAGGTDAMLFATIGKNLSIDYLDFLVRDNHLA